MQKYLPFFILLGLVSCNHDASTGDNSGGGGGGHTNGSNNFSLQPTSPPDGSILGILNVCDQTIWVQTPDKDNGVPTNQQLMKVPAHTQVNYSTTSLQSLRLWPKFNCNLSGNNCGVGQELDPCFSNGGCQPPIDTSFELTNTNPNEVFYDITMVNGFTAPLKVVVFGDNLPAGCKNIATPENLSISSICPQSEILNTPTADWDASTPAGIKFGDYGDYHNPFGQVIHLASPQSLVAPALNDPSKTIGCFSPGQKLVSVPAWGGLGVGACVGDKQCSSENTPLDINYNGALAGSYDSRVIMYQNPYSGCDLTDGQYTSTNGNCKNGTLSPIQTKGQTGGLFASPNTFSDNLVHFCLENSGANAKNSIYCSDNLAAASAYKTAGAAMGHLGPIVKTQYVTQIHNNVPNVYAWQYDDVNGLQECDSAAAKFVVVIGCPVP